MTLRKVLLAAVVLVTVYVVWDLTRQHTLDTFESDEEHFKYGSIGSETGGTLLHPIGGLLPPAPIFKALPKVCSGVPTRTGVSSYTVVQSYEDFGLIYEEAKYGKKRDLPVGISRRYRLGMEILGINCALCHAGTVRTAPGAARKVIPGMPPQQVDVQRLFRFMFDCVGSAEFTASRVIEQIERDEGRLWPHERARYRILVPRLRGQLATLDGKIGVLTTERVTASGPGRLDTINPGKPLEVGWDLDGMLTGSRKAELIATTDFPSAWRLTDRTGYRMHWDGNFGSVDEVLHSALLAVGAKPQTLDSKAFDRVRRYLSDLKQPSFPFPHDATLAAAGKGIFKDHCAHCHEIGAPDIGQVTSNDTLGVDAYRLNAFTPAYATSLQVALNQNYARSGFKFVHVQKTGGYANMPLDGVWARAPYLHNGSVPSLRDLLQPEGCRPPKFRRGSDVYDPVNVGFVSYAAPPTDTDCPPPSETRPGPTFEEGAGITGLFEFDTRLPGNGNMGHTGAAFGTDLTPEQKRQLLEFLKTR